MSAMLDAFKAVGLVSSRNAFDCSNLNAVSKRGSSQKLFDLGMYRYTRSKNRIPGREFTSKVETIYKPFTEESKLTREVNLVLVRASEWYSISNKIELPALECFFYSSADLICVSVDDFCRVVSVARNCDLKFELAIDDTSRMCDKNSVLIRII